MRVLHLASALLLLSGIPAYADTLQYTFGPIYSYEPTHTFSFELPSQPSGADFLNYPSAQAFAIRGVSALADGEPGTFYAVFNYTQTGGGGGFVLGGSLYGGPTFSYSLLSGGPLYSGVPSSPTLLTGTFDLQEFGSPYGGNPGRLTVTDLSTAPTPEPSTLALLCTGLLTAGGLLKQRRHTRR